MNALIIPQLVSQELDFRESGFENYLRDESRFQGHADGVVKARSESDVVKTLALCNQTRTALTVASGRTSLTGAPVPLGGIILDVTNLNNLDSGNPSKVGPGIILSKYKQFVDSVGLFYPPDPTSEDSCTLGGNVACNASGALSYFYGPTRDYIQAIRIVLPTGHTLDLHRSQIISADGFFRIRASELDPNPSEDLLIPAPNWITLPWKFLKNTAGFYSDSPMDLIDLFIGSEGILGVFSEVTTRLLKKRRPFFSIIIYMPDREKTVQFVEILNSLRNSYMERSGDFYRRDLICEACLNPNPVEFNFPDFDLVTPSCMEWIGNSTASLLPNPHKDLISGFYGAIFVEQEYDDNEQMVESAAQWASLIEKFNRSNVDASRPVETEVALDSRQTRSFRSLRQSIPEKLNEKIHPGFSKIGTDFSVPARRLSELLAMYDRELPRNSSYVFGHIGNSHLHANILPRNIMELEMANQTMMRMMELIISMGGTISGEHGIGKIKNRQFEATTNNTVLERMTRIKMALDPNWILNRRTLLRYVDRIGT